ncbi:MAG: hypothetical protein ACTSUD_06685 [Alphaproteobacteria bacterium]
MKDLLRAMPRPIPAIHPLPEYLAAGATKDRYEDMKSVLQVPWMGVVTMAYAHYPNFFDTLWEGLRDLCRSGAYVECARALRRFTEDEVVSLDPPPIAERLASLGYAPREIEQIADTIEIFSHGNFVYLPMAAIVSMLLHGGEIEGKGDAPAFEGRHAPDSAAPFVLMEAHHGDAPSKALYEDIKRTLGLPFVNTDYRAFARWPSYFALAWGDLKPCLAGAGHEAIGQGLHERALGFAAAFPNPGGLTSQALIAAAKRDAPLAEIIGMAKLFFYLLPGLVTNVAFFRHQLPGR